MIKSVARLLILALGLWSINAIAQNSKVLIKTDFGDITVELYADESPITVDNFLGYVRRYYYDGLIFHRVVKGFVIQTGGYTFDLFEKEPGEPIANESANGLKNRRGTLAMARHSDPDSARAQFYINLRDNSNLDARPDKPGYTVFGNVVAGMDVIDAISKVRTERLDQELANLPLDPVRILSIREIETP